MPKLKSTHPEGFAEILVVSLIALASIFLVGGLSVKKANLSATTNAPVIPDFSAATSATNSNLQIQTFSGKLVTPAPITEPPPPPAPGPSVPPTSPGPTAAPTTPPNICPGTGDPLPITNSCTCPTELYDGVGCPLGSKQCSDDPSNLPTWPNGVTFSGVVNSNCWYLKLSNGSSNQGFTEHIGAPGCTEACVGKPVIYLYPVNTTNVNVKLTIPGSIYLSDPLYPSDGWKNVEAHPDGTLIYQGKNYKELYYESELNKKIIPENGILIERSNIHSKLSEILYKLGLKESEKQEFFDYWMPKLNETKSKYILFSVLSKSQKESIDHVDIFPKPDTFIDFIVYFKPTDTPVNLRPLNIPDSPPQRIGFTAVEWGGSLDLN